MNTKIENVDDASVEAEAKTEIEANTEIEIKRMSTKEIIAYLTEKFPKCFSLEGPAKALKIGIFQDLAEKLAEDETVSKTRLRQALRHYTSSWRYLKAIKLGAFRIDIDGVDVAEIDQEQADYASKTLTESQEKFGNKKPKDKNDNKQYKGKKAEVKKASDRKPGAENSTVNKHKEKFKTVKSTKRAQPAVEVKLKPIEVATIVIGNAVKVKLGNSPIDAVITEVAGNDVSVQLNSGMVVKTTVKNIFTE